MIYRNFTKLFLILTLAMLACGFPTASALPTAIPTVPQLSLDQLKHAQYQLGARDDHMMVQLTDGKYQQGTDATTLDFAYIALTEFTSIGDINGDGVNEAASIFFENYGGTGNFAFLAIYTNSNGLPVFLTSIIIDDRPLVNSLAIENDEVHLDVTIHGSEDPACCPALPTTRQYTLLNTKLLLTNYTTATPDGKKRSIEITSPANGTESTGSVQVSGTASIAPFENTLSYFIYDQSGNQLSFGPVTVTAPDLGAPGSFSESITLADIPAGTIIYLEIQDASAADGSLLAQDAVKLVMR